MAPEIQPSKDPSVVDFKKLDAPDEEAWRAVGADLKTAFSEVGYVQLVNHGVPYDVVKKMFATSGEFFKFPADQKNFLETDGYHGYMALGRQKIGQNFELRETLDLSYKDGPFPDSLVPELKAAWMDINTHLSALALRVMKALEFGLNLEENRLVRAHDVSPETNHIKAMTRLTHYPPVPTGCPPNSVRLEPHTDYGALTFDIQDEHGGLEVRNRKGEWVAPTSPQKGAVLVILGDVMEKWMNGTLRATEHRVMVPDDEALRLLPRRSLVYFLYPDPDELFAPFDGSATETSSVTVKEYIHYKQMKTLNY